MRNEILRKLRSELTRPIRSERQVVYIMAEIRKFLELLQQKSACPFLVLYCDWVLHPRLCGTTARQVIGDVDALVEDDNVSSRDNEDKLELLQLKAFRNNLLDFLSKHHLSAALCTDDKRWNTFLKFYMEVVRECPLEITAKETTKRVTVKRIATKRVDKIVITAPSYGTKLGATGGQEPMLMINWDFYYRGQRFRRFSLNT